MRFLNRLSVYPRLMLIVMLLAGASVALMELVEQTSSVPVVFQVAGSVLVVAGTMLIVGVVAASDGWKPSLLRLGWLAVWLLLMFLVVGAPTLMVPVFVAASWVLWSGFPPFGFSLESAGTLYKVSMLLDGSSGRKRKVTMAVQGKWDGDVVGFVCSRTPARRRNRVKVVPEGWDTKTGVLWVDTSKLVRLPRVSQRVGSLSGKDKRKLTDRLSRSKVLGS